MCSSTMTRPTRRPRPLAPRRPRQDRKSTRLNSSHSQISYAVFCLKKKNHPLAAPPLRMVHLRRHALDVACVRDWDDDVLLGDQVLDLHVEGLGLDFRSSFYAVLVLHLEEFGLDDV